MKKLDATKPVVLCGDLNVAHLEIGQSVEELCNTSCPVCVCVTWTKIIV